jgi:hypothetical protein
MQCYTAVLAAVLVLTGCGRQDTGGTYGTDTGTGAAGGITTSQPTEPPALPPEERAPAPPTGLQTQQDQQLMVQVRQALTRGATVADAQNVQVSVQNGAVILSGTVPSEAERQEMEQQARQVQGVQSVNNQLQVLGQEAPAAPGTAQNSGGAGRGGQAPDQQREASPAQSE